MISGNYNNRPDGWQELTAREFADHYYFHYCLKKAEYRQIKSDPNNIMSGLLSARLYELEYASADGLGVAIVNDWLAARTDETKVIRYYRFGDPEKWEKFRSRFASQFAHDNS